MRFNIVRLIFFCVVVFLFYKTAISQVKTYFTERVFNNPPKIDGLLNDDCWNLVEWEGDFIQRKPYGGEKATEETKFKVLYDDNNIYVGIRLFDKEPEKIERRLTTRDQDAGGDLVFIGIDSYDDNLTAFVFFVNAAGVQGDFFMSNDGETNHPYWNAIFDVKTSIDSLGWIAEFRIPLSQLRFANGKDHNWGFQIVRDIFRTQETNMWQFIPMESKAVISKFGNLTGIKNIKPRLDSEILPYVVGEIDRYKKQDGNPYATGKDDRLKLGIDGKLGITNDLTVNFTINPDFGQVEADPSEVNLTAYETFFEERRPFFIEGNNIFNFSVNNGDGPSPSNLFYSRRIGRFPQRNYDKKDGEYFQMPQFTNILGAVKLSGKTRKGLSIGILESVTSEMSANISLNGDERKEIVEPLTNYFVTRVQKDYNKGNTVLGGIFTATNRKINKQYLEFLPKAAYTGGIDFTHYWKNKTYVITSKVYFSYLKGTTDAITKIQEASNRYYQRPDITHRSVDTTKTVLSGSGAFFQFRKEGESPLKYGITTNWKSPGLDLNDIGFVGAVDRIILTEYLTYDIFKPSKIFRSTNFLIANWNLIDFGANLIDQGMLFRQNSQFLNNWGYFVQVMRQFKMISRSELRGGPSLLLPNTTTLEFTINSNQNNRFGFIIGVNKIFSNENFTNRTGVTLITKYQATNALSFSLAPTYIENRNEIQYVNNIKVNGVHKYILGTFHQKQLGAAIRFNLILSPDFTLQFYGQPFIFAGRYDNFKRITNSKAKKYSDRFHQFESTEISYNSNNNVYDINENEEQYSFDNPNFNFFQFRSNLVLRWEYSPGSNIYLVWSQGRTADNSVGKFNFSDNIGTLFDIYPNNIFLLKFSYRFVL